MSDTTNTNFDLIVIGSGPGGYVAAIRAAQLGMRVACVEKDASLGGTCLNIGCIPSKALLDSSELFHQAAATFARHGITIPPPTLDLPTMMSRKDNVVSALTRGVASLFKKNKIEHVRGAAAFIAPDTLEITSASAIPARRESRRISAQNILIATGSIPIELPAMKFDGKFFLDSTAALALPAVPKRLLIIGAGAIGLELGSVWRRLGAEVMVIEFMDRCVPLMDQEMAQLLQRALEKQGFAFRFGTTAESARVEKGQVTVNWKSGEQTGAETADHMLVAVGRRPYTAGLGLETIGVATDRRGAILADGQYRTNVPGVWAIGDCIGGAMLAHKAEEEGIAAVENMAGKSGHVNYRAVASVVYTFPELASVGLTEQQAAEKGPINVGRFPFAANGRARALDATEGQVKIIGDARTDRLLGMHILGPRASDLIAEGATAIELIASTEDIAKSVHAHPTLTEAIKEAALAAHKSAIHI